ncbi:MAG: flagellar hook-length control protein FliK [Nitratireductor sp.]|nr:flagellar hook-length control protein FliK [Nitratireductor sp.]
MSSANMMSGLLNASGLKERLQELSGKTKPQPSGFPQSEAHPARGGSGDEEFAAQFDRLTKEASVKDLPDFSNSETAKEGPKENPATFADVETNNEVNTGIEAEGAMADTMVEIEEDQDATDVSESKGSADAETAPEANEHRHDDTPGFVPPAAAAAVRPVELQGPQPVARVPGDDISPVQAEGNRKADVLDGARSWQADLQAKRDGASAARIDGRMAEQPVQAFGRYNGSDLFQRPVTVNAGRSGQPVAEAVLRQGGTGSMPGEAPLVPVTGFRMSLAQPAQPGNFSERFSRQLDMMRPVFRTFPGSDGLSKAIDAGGQVMALQTGNAVGGTIPQVQQAIQASLVDLAKESTSNGPVTKTMELSLLPRSLGVIKVHMVHSGNQINVEITTHTAAATHAMETAKNDILKAYLQYGIQPDDVNIRVMEIRDATQPSLPAGSEQDRSSQGSGQGLARNGAGSSMAERQENASHTQEANLSHRDEGLKQAEAAKQARSNVMGKVQYF